MRDIIDANENNMNIYERLKLIFISLKLIRNKSNKNPISSFVFVKLNELFCSIMCISKRLRPIMSSIFPSFILQITRGGVFDFVTYFRNDFYFVKCPLHNKIEY